MITINDKFIEHFLDRFHEITNEPIRCVRVDYPDSVPQNVAHKFISFCPNTYTYKVEYSVPVGDMTTKTHLHYVGSDKAEAAEKYNEIDVKFFTNHVDHMGYQFQLKIYE